MLFHFSYITLSYSSWVFTEMAPKIRWKSVKLQITRRLLQRFTWNIAHKNRLKKLYMKMSLFIDYHGISKIAKIRITLIVCLSSATLFSFRTLLKSIWNELHDIKLSWSAVDWELWIENMGRRFNYTTNLETLSITIVKNQINCALHTGRWTVCRKRYFRRIGDRNRKED